jgi:hypothetical protein
MRVALDIQETNMETKPQYRFYSKCDPHLLSNSYLSKEFAELAVNSGFEIKPIIGAEIHPAEIKVGDILSYDDIGAIIIGEVLFVEKTDKSSKYVSRGEVKITVNGGSFLNLSWDGDDFYSKLYKLNV